MLGHFGDLANGGETPRSSHFLEKGKSLLRVHLLYANHPIPGLDLQPAPFSNPTQGFPALNHPWNPEPVGIIPTGQS